MESGVVAGTTYACCLKMFLSAVFLKKIRSQGKIFLKTLNCVKNNFPRDSCPKLY